MAASAPSTSTDNRFLRLAADNLYAMGGGVPVPVTETNPDYAYYVAKNLYAIVAAHHKTVSTPAPRLGEEDNMLLRKIAVASHALTH
jgi:hypothetical protein